MHLRDALGQRRNVCFGDVRKDRKLIATQFLELRIHKQHVHAHTMLNPTALKLRRMFTA